MPPSSSYIRRTRFVVRNAAPFFPDDFHAGKDVFYVPNWITEIVWEALSKLFPDCGPIPADDDDELGDNPERLQAKGALRLISEALAQTPAWTKIVNDENPRLDLLEKDLANVLVDGEVLNAKNLGARAFCYFTTLAGKTPELQAAEYGSLMIIRGLKKVGDDIKALVGRTSVGLRKMNALRLCAQVSTSVQIQ